MLHTAFGLACGQKCESAEDPRQSWTEPHSLRQAIVPDLQSTLMVSVRYFYQGAQQQAQQAQQTQQSQQAEQ